MADFEDQRWKLLDPHGRIHRFEWCGWSAVGKRCPSLAGRWELKRATEAWRRLHGLMTTVSLTVEVIIPEITEASPGECVLITPNLGDPLSMHPDLAAEVLPRSTLLTLLNVLLGVGLEAPGFVPRNLFYRSGRLFAIDWEDACFADRPVAPSALTVMKWDIAWSDVYRCDPGIRYSIQSRRVDEPPLDSFERALLDLTGAELTPTDARAWGVDLTLRSELYVAEVLGVTAAELGHIADEMLPAQYSVLYTMLTAHLRAVGGEQVYAEVLTDVWNAVQIQMTAGKRNTERDELHDMWLRALCTAADCCLGPPRTEGSLTELHYELSELAAYSGWATACRRAELAEALLVRICALVVSALDLIGLELILRGSLAQGLVTRRSDLDFELSSPRHPCGHHGAERLVVGILAAFGFEAEASAGRPTEADLYDPRSGLTRDLHEWMELRQPSSDLHDPGWLRQVFATNVDQLVSTDSLYERTGQQRSEKYVWFEARALLARLAFRHAQEYPPATISQQLDLLSNVINEASAEEIRSIVQTALDLREHPDPELTSVVALQNRIADVRRRLDLPGPVNAPNTL